MRQRPKEVVIKKLFGLSGNLCAFPTCKQEIIESDGEIVGEICHIEAASPGGERYNPNQTEEERASFENLILFCANHHKITNNVKKYTVKKLAEIKRNHEKKFKSKTYDVSDDVIKKIINITYPIQNISNHGDGTLYATQTGDIVHQGLSLSDATELFSVLMEKSLSEYALQAHSVALSNIEQLKGIFYQKANGRISAEEMQKFADPDTQHMLRMASADGARQNDQTLHGLLSELVIERIKNADDEIKRLVINEAIPTVSKISKNQMKIITLCWLMQYSSFNNVTSWESLNQIFEQLILPLTDFKRTRTEFQHIEYAGCGKIEITSFTVTNNFKSYFTFLFVRPVTKEEINSVGMPPEELDNHLDKQADGTYSFKARKREELVEQLGNDSAREYVNNRLISLYDSATLNDEEIKQKIISDTKFGKPLYEAYEGSMLKNLSITSVGTVIAIAYLKETTGLAVNIDTWIN